MMTITTEPPGAACTLTRTGKVLGEIAATPGTITFSRESGDLLIACTKPGYQSLQVTEAPLAAVSVMSAAGGVYAIASLVDSASGANYRYRREIPLKLIPIGVMSDPDTSTPLSLNNLRLR